jgi:hypothetical protein
VNAGLLTGFAKRRKISVTLMEQFCLLAYNAVYPLKITDVGVNVSPPFSELEGTPSEIPERISIPV